MPFSWTSLGILVPCEGLSPRAEGYTAPDRSHTEHLSLLTLRTFITQVFQKPCLNRITLQLHIPESNVFNTPSCPSKDLSVFFSFSKQFWPLMYDVSGSNTTRGTLFPPWLYFDLYLCLDLLCEWKDLSILWSLAQDTFPTITSVVSQNNIDGKRQGFLWWGKQDRKRVGAEPEPTPVAWHFSVCSGYTSSQWWFTPTIVKPWRISLRNIKIPKVSNFLDKANSHRESFSKQWIVF